MAIRVNGTARLSAEDTLRARFTREGKRPRTVIVIRLAEVYSQCARALQCSELWTSGEQSAALPTPGGMLDKATAGEIDGATYDADRTTRTHLGWW